MPYVKSHSNYLLKKEHQNVKNGKVYERDLLTIGALDQFAPGQTPIYKSGNFIFTVNDEPFYPKKPSETSWFENESGSTWSIANLIGLDLTTNASSDKRIELKNDFYSLRDFAYYGSCVTLVRGSITDIINRFPSEMYIPTEEVDYYYTPCGQANDDIVFKVQDLMIPLGNKLVVKNHNDDIRYSGFTLNFFVSTNKAPIYYSNITGVPSTYTCPCNVDPKDTTFNTCKESGYIGKIQSNSGTPHNFSISCEDAFGKTIQEIVDEYNTEIDNQREHYFNELHSRLSGYCNSEIENTSKTYITISGLCTGNTSTKNYTTTGSSVTISMYDPWPTPTITEDTGRTTSGQIITTSNQYHLQNKIYVNGELVAYGESATYNVDSKDIGKSCEIIFGEKTNYVAPHYVGVVRDDGISIDVTGTYAPKKCTLSINLNGVSAIEEDVNIKINGVNNTISKFSRATLYLSAGTEYHIDVPYFANTINGFEDKKIVNYSGGTLTTNTKTITLGYKQHTITTSGKSVTHVEMKSKDSTLNGIVEDLENTSYNAIVFHTCSKFNLIVGFDTYSAYYYFNTNGEIITSTTESELVWYNLPNSILATYKKHYVFHESANTRYSYSDVMPQYMTNERLVEMFPQYFVYEDISQSGITVGSESISVDDKFYGVKNPFRIDTTREYATKVEIDDNPLKYFNVIGWEKYDIINANGDVEPISAVETEYIEGSSIFGPDKEKIVGDLICETYISGASGTTLQLSSFISNNKIVRQLIPFDGEYEEYQYRGYHIRPKYEYYVDFIDSLDSFQKILMSLKTEPIYKATFETISEGNVAYENRLVDYIFPIDDGGYNLDIQSMAYNVYLSSLVNIATYYDERFSDNMYRNMTHESIKNMDWTYRTPDDDNADDYDNGETRVAQLIRLFGREFDEIKYYIDNIKNANTITYNDINNTPNYFLSDNLELKGWDAQQVQFEYLSEYFFDENGDKIFREIDYSANTFVDTSYTYVENENIVSGDGNTYHLNRLFSQIDDLVVCPYYSEDKGYFVSGNCESIIRYPSSGNVYLIDEKFGYHSRVKSFASDYCYTPNQVNNEFLKRLILSSRSIFSRKGTIESIEELLSLFGLRSKRWITEMSDNEFYEDSKVWDFDIKEYTTYTNPLLDIFNEYYDNNFIDFINSTKEIPLHETEYVKYEGLPISYEEDVIREGETDDIDEIGELKSKNTTIYPFFINGYMYDDNLYYQSSGGWLIKEPFQMTKDNDIRTKNDTEDCKNYLYTETVNTIRYVKTINDLFDIPFSELRNNIMVNVEDLSQDYVIIDEQLFKIEKEDWGSGVTMFFTIECGDKSLYFGNHSYYYDEESGVTWYSDGNTTEPLNTNNIEVTSINGNDEKRIVNIPTLSDGEKIKVYIAQSESVEGRYVFAIGDYVSLNTCFLMGGNYDFVKKEEGKTPTTYFRLEDIYGNYKIGSGGWMQVYAEDEEYKHLRTITETSFGNNPHNGNMRYDCGYEYIDHFDKLFKLPYEDSLIDTRCYKSYYEEIMDNDGNSLLPLIGFKGIKCSDDDCAICYKEYEDTKVHDFCDIIEDSGNTASYYDKPKYGDDNTRHLSGMSPNDDELTYEEIYEQISSYTSNVVETYDYNPITSGLPINDNTNQIVNLKRVDLIFNMEKDHVGEYQSKNYLEAYHYIDNVIMKYVEQVIPSNVIMKVVYKSDNG